MTTIPDQFVGSYNLERSEKFDEYLAAKGVGWMLRKLINLSGETRTFSISDDRQTSHLQIKNSKSTMDYDFVMGNEIEGKGQDGKMHKIKFYTDDNNETLCEEHNRFEEPGTNNIDVYKYTIDGHYLVMHMVHENIHCKRFLKKSS